MHILSEHALTHSLVRLMNLSIAQRDNGVDDSIIALIECIVAFAQTELEWVTAGLTTILSPTVGYMMGIIQ